MSDIEKWLIVKTDDNKIKHSLVLLKNDEEYARVPLDEKLVQAIVKNSPYKKSNTLALIIAGSVATLIFLVSFIAPIIQSLQSLL